MYKSVLFTHERQQLQQLHLSVNKKAAFRQGNYRPPRQQEHRRPRHLRRLLRPQRRQRQRRQVLRQQRHIHSSKCFDANFVGGMDRWVIFKKDFFDLGVKCAGSFGCSCWQMLSLFLWDKQRKSIPVSALRYESIQELKTFFRNRAISTYRE
jgi:hypothetical protein